MTDNPSQETLAGGAVNTPADGGGTVVNPAIPLEELNKVLGADYKDPSTALKSLKDTKDYVGKRKEDIAAEVRAGLPASPDVTSKSDVQALKEELFYSQNPQYKDYQSMIQKLGSNPADVVGSQEFKTVFDKVKVADEVAQSKSVAPTNARISQSPAVIEQAVQVANARGTTNEDVAMVFARQINSEAQGQ